MTRSEFFQSVLGLAVGAETQVAAKDLGTSQEKRLIALECGFRFKREEDVVRLRADLKPFEDEFNCKFIVFEQGLTAKVLFPAIQPMPLESADLDTMRGEVRRKS